MILVTGASGNVGGEVLRQLIAAKQPVRAMYRSQTEAAKAPKGLETVVADFADPQSLAKALEGIEKLYLVCAPVPDLVKLETNAVETAQKKKIKHIVLNSALGAGTFNASFPSWHRQVEQALERSGIPYTIIRPNSFMQNIAAFYAPTIRSEGRFYAAMGSARNAFIDVRDIAAFIVKTLTTSGSEKKIYELNGPEAVTYSELAARISAVSGRPIQYVDLPRAELGKAMLASGMPQWLVDALLELQRYYTEGGGGQVDAVVKNVIGREPIHLDQYLRENADAFKAAKSVA
jgi:uncharacterized protein YbjT (DUF2867 family)